MNDFKHDIKFSHDNEKFWDEIYRTLFSDFHYLETVEVRRWQFKGVDRVVYLTGGHAIHVEEKLRRKFYNDILLEYTSNDRTNTLGWIEKQLNVDYLIYAFLDIRKAFAFPWVLLQSAWFTNKHVWLHRYGTRIAKNRGYNTLSCPVPTDILTKSVMDSMEVKLQ